MATLNEIQQHLGMGTKYEFDGSLFYDSRRNTGTLYLEILDTESNYRTPMLRIGFNEFYNSTDQYQTKCQIKETGEYISGIYAKVFVPCAEVAHYQIDIILNEVERYTMFWAPEASDNNCVASSTALLTPFEDLFERQRQSSAKIKQFINGLS